MALQPVHVRVNDAATGRPTPVRIRVTDAAGATYFPLGVSPEFPVAANDDVGGRVRLRGERWAYIDGTCEMLLPAGQLRVQASKGPEFAPLDEMVHHVAGKLALRVAIRRQVDLAADGWYAADARCHALPPHAALLEGQAEGLAFVHLLIAGVARLSNDGETYLAHPNLVAFSGQRECLERDGCRVAVNTLNRHALLGSFGLLHAHRVVHPLEFGGVYGSDDWSLADWAEQCHRKGGLVTWMGAFRQGTPFVGEGLANLLLGQVDAVEVEPAALGSSLIAQHHRLLNLGVRVPLVGAGGKDSNATPLGAVRTYARIDSEPTLAAWVAAVKAGRTFVTSGPLLRFTAGSTVPGDMLPADTDVTIDATVVGPVVRFDLLHNGAVLHSTKGDTLAWQGRPSPGWLAVRAVGVGQPVPFAHSSPVYVGDAPPAADATPFIDQLKRGLAWVETEATFEQPRSRERLRGTFRAALAKLGAGDA